MRITENNGVYEGKVEKIFNRQPDDDPDHLCRKCEGERKDKPIIGMTILWGLKKDGDQYGGGEILDPEERQDLPRQDEAHRRRQQARGARLHRRVAVRPLADLGAGGVRCHAGQARLKFWGWGCEKRTSSAPTRSRGWSARTRSASAWRASRSRRTPRAEDIAAARAAGHGPGRLADVCTHRSLRAPAAQLRQVVLRQRARVRARLLQSARCDRLSAQRERPGLDCWTGATPSTPW